ncbi:MAG: hypothetical protein MUF25_15640 [Pirellulaceae bacterium]|nr:hypothetical protein [Pirellulaceae bacterium]
MTATTADAAQPQPRTDRITRWLLVAIGIYSFGLVTLLNVAVLSSGNFLNSDNREFSVICMAADLGKFTSGKPAERHKGQEIEVTGVLEQFRDKLQIRLSDPAQIEIVVAAPSKPTPAKPTPAPGSSPVELKKIGPDAWSSPAGLIYQGRDPAGRTRVDHVLRHARDIPDRDGSHGVFDGGPDAVFGVLDEAWRNVEKTKLRPVIEGDRSLYTVPMGRRVGYLGGRAGASRGHPPLTRIFLVIQTGTKSVITAFPR